MLQPIRVLLDMSAKVRAGDLSARSGLRRSSEELSQLGAALDDMADQLQLREAKLREALSELHGQAMTDLLPIASSSPPIPRPASWRMASIHVPKKASAGR